MNFGANFSNFFDKGKTFRPKKKFQPGTLKYSLHKQAQASLNSGINLRQVSLWNDLGIKLHNSHVSHGEDQKYPNGYVYFRLCYYPKERTSMTG